MSRVLVTGAAGFIGAAIAKALLARGDQVLGIDNLNDYYDPALKRARLAGLAGPGFTFHPYDFALEMPLAGERFDRIIHLGAQPGVRYSLENPRAYVQSNLVGHLNLLELARSAQVPMVYASSSSVYGNNAKMPFSVEDRVDHPVSLYAATKKADELMSETYAHLYRIPLTGLRFFTVYGPWGRPDMAPWLFTKAILAGEPIKVFNHGKMSRDFTYIDDIVAGVIACSDNPPADDGVAKPGGSVAPHSIYNIGNNQPGRTHPIHRNHRISHWQESHLRLPADATRRCARDLCRHRCDFARPWLCADDVARRRHSQIRRLVQVIPRRLTF